MSMSQGERNLRPALIFDFDGTLFDPLYAIEFSLAEALKSHGLPAVSTETVRTFIGPPLQIALKSHLSIDDGTAGAVISSFRSHHQIHALHLYEPYPGMKESVRKLSQTFDLHIASSKPQFLLDLLVDRENMRGFFKSIVGSEPGDTGAKAKYLRAVLGEGQYVPSQVWMIGDRSFDMEAAKVCGTRALGVRWGYGSNDELNSSGADLVCSSYEELCQIVMSAEEA